MLLLCVVVVIINVAPQCGNGSSTEYWEEAVGVWEHGIVGKRSSRYMGEVGGLHLNNEVCDVLPCAPTLGSDNFVIREGTVPRACPCQCRVSLRDLEPLQVLDRRIENGTLVATFRGGVVEHLADSAVAAARVVVVAVLGDVRVDLYGVMGSVLVGVNGRVIP